MNVKGYHFLILAEIQGMMRMTCFGAAACAEPFGVITLTKFNHVPDTRGQISALFNNGTPGRPYSRRITAADMGKNILEGVHVLFMKTRIENRIHQVRIGCALGIDIEHQKAVITVCFRNTGNGLQSSSIPTTGFVDPMLGTVPVTPVGNGIDNSLNSGNNGNQNQ